MAAARMADAEVRRQWAAQLLTFWKIYNREYLDGALQPPTLRLGDQTAVHGTWRASTREICIALQHVNDSSWLEVLGTLRHEMAHQYVSEVLRRDDETAHGPAFAQACQLLRVEPTATGGDDVHAAETSRVLERVHKLFALGASPNRNEAEAAMRKAHALVATYELRDLESGAVRDYGVRELGPVKKRHARWEQLLAGLLGEFFCVEPIWSPSYDARQLRAGTALHVYGAERNLAMAEHVHVCLGRMLDPLWRGHRRRHPEILGDRDRQRYMEGVLVGFRSRLLEQGRSEQAVRELALVQARGGDLRLTEFYRWHNPRLRSGRSTSFTLSEAHQHGVQAGKRISLQTPIESGGGPAGLIESSGG